MNGKQFLWAALFAILLPMTTQAQLSQIQRGQRGYTQPPVEPRETTMSVENTLENINAKMEIYETEFSLDAFEKEVMKNTLVDFEERRMATMANENMEYKAKLEAVQKSQEQLASDLQVFLTQEEVARFGELHFGAELVDKEIRKKKKERKKKRKKKSNK